MPGTGHKKNAFTNTQCMPCSKNAEKCLARDIKNSLTQRMPSSKNADFFSAGDRKNALTNTRCMPCLLMQQNIHRGG